MTLAELLSSMSLAEYLFFSVWFAGGAVVVVLGALLWRVNRKLGFFLFMGATFHFIICVLVYSAVLTESYEGESGPRMLVDQDVCIEVLGGRVETLTTCRIPSGHLIRMGKYIEHSELLELPGRL